MRKFLHKTDLNGSYSRLAIHEGNKIFNHTIFTLSICTLAIMFIWYCGINSLNSKNQNLLFPQIEQSQGDKLSSSSQIQNAEAIKSHLANMYKDNSDKQNIVDKKSTEMPKASVAKIPVKQVKDKSKDKNFGSVKKTIYIGANTTKIAVTFDDGYNKKMVEKVLDVLKKEGIKTTFFIIGKVLEEYPEVWQRAIKEGHQICNHTNNHKLLTNMSDNLIQDEIQGWESSAQKVFGENYIKRMKKEFPYLRLPGGGGENSTRILSIAQKNGYTVVGWNLETFSSVINLLKKTHSVQDISTQIEHHIVNRCTNGSIILLHFNQYDTGNIEKIILGIKKRGFNIQQLSQIIK